MAHLQGTPGPRFSGRKTRTSARRGLRLAKLDGSSVNSILKQVNSGESENRVARRSNAERVLYFALSPRWSYTTHGIERTLEGRAGVGGDSYTQLGRCTGPESKRVSTSSQMSKVYRLEPCVVAPHKVRFDLLSRADESLATPSWASIVFPSHLPIFPFYRATVPFSVADMSLIWRDGMRSTLRCKRRKLTKK